jgi:tRNA-splicing ligase RtcB
MGSKIKGRDLIQLGFPKNNSVNIALGLISQYRKKEKKDAILREAKQVLLEPEKYANDAIWGKVVEGLLNPVEVKMQELNTHRAPFAIYGENEIDEESKRQLYTALKLPVSVRGALMPDAHSGYGLPIGGVLAAENAIIPYGVGVDIGCRMALTIFDAPASFFMGQEFQLRKMLSEHTKFGMSEVHKTKNEHAVMDNALFSELPILKKLKSKAYQQLGTSGGGNHFVEFGFVDITDKEMGIPIGQYFALLSHSGSRGLGANIAKHYTQLAIKQCPLPKGSQHLAWLRMDTHDGMEYWKAMNLAGDYAKACHDDIHQRMAKLIGVRKLMTIENHHNFAWKELVDGRECIVHRKGATPAARGVLGIIPGSMAAPGYIVRGKGNEESINSASHGAGRLFSRAACKSKFTKSEMQKMLEQHGIELIGGNVDENPMAYKDIKRVISNQTDLVDVVGSFHPKIVRMDK